jgi:hypothetical protein
MLCQVIPCLCFYSPSLFCKVIDSSLRKFWWGFPQDKRHNLFLLGWNIICSPIDVGGLGLKNMECQNLALLSKIGWKLLTNQDLLWVKALSTKYLQSYSFLASPVPPSKRAPQIQICSGQRCLLFGLRWL